MIIIHQGKLIYYHDDIHEYCIATNLQQTAWTDVDRDCRDRGDKRFRVQYDRTFIGNNAQDAQRLAISKL